VSAPAEDARPAILVVDDDEPGRELLVRILNEQGGYESSAAANAVEARELLSRRTYAAAMIDCRMPGESGIEFLGHVRDHYPDTAAIMCTALDDPVAVRSAFKMGAFAFVVKPYRVNEILMSLSNALQQRAKQIQARSYIKELEDKVLHRTKLLRDALALIGGSGLAPMDEEDEVIDLLSGALGGRDDETAGHIRRVSTYSALLAERVGLDNPHDEIRLASTLHDIGKIGIPDAILQKPGSLGAEERGVMDRHTLIGNQLLSESQSRLLNLGATIALTHHEKWDGTGYPAGLAGDDIPAVGRVTAIADVFDSLTNDRVYRPALEVGEAVQVMRQGDGTHFDPGYLDVFLESIPTVISLRDKNPEPQSAWRG
jgi:putative two-component system response regulator